MSFFIYTKIGTLFFNVFRKGIIMRKGFDAALLFTNSGNLYAIATGSDACAEHECGSKPMQQALCSGKVNEEKLQAQLREAKAYNGGFIAKLLGFKTVSYPNLFESKRISKNLDKIQFVEITETNEALLVFGAAASSPYVQSELTYGFKEQGKNNKVAGAWDEQSFGIKVQGDKYVKALRKFHQNLMQGKGVFAGTFMPRSVKVDDELVFVGGVVIAVEPFLPDAVKSSIKEAQGTFEGNMRLKAFSRDREITVKLKALSGKNDFNYIWPVWKNGKVDTEIMYAMNPGYAVKADYYGPYTEGQILTWATAKCTYQLTVDSEDTYCDKTEANVTLA